MIQEHLASEVFHQEFFDETTIHPVGIITTVALGFATMLLPRRHALFPLVILACFIPTAQRIVVMGLDFTMLRIMLLFGWSRILLRGELRDLRRSPLDFAILAWAFAKVIAHAGLYKSGGPVITVLGELFIGLGMYFMARCLIRDFRDLDRLAKQLITVSVPVAVAFLIEKTTGRNWFSIFGGVPEITEERAGSLRCQGAYAHPILAGCFWSALIPIMATQWWRPLGKPLAILGVSCGITVIIACSSSTPVAALVAGVGATFLFPMRRHMALIRWAVVAGAVFIHIIRPPVWSVVALVDFTGSSTGWHRFILIDAAIRNFGEWAVFGIEETGHWGPSLYDVANQYVAEAVRGGILGFIAFIWMITIAYFSVGKTWRLVQRSRTAVAMTWALGISLFIHCMNFVGVSYFGQEVFGWFVVLGAITSLHSGAEARFGATATARTNTAPRLTTVPG